VDVKFPILFKHKKVFVWYSGRWINIQLEAQSHGGGFKGYLRFFYHWFRCMIGIHRTGHFCGFTRINGKANVFESYTACMYCRGDKQLKKEK
jgi:hypothetical protein